LVHDYSGSCDADHRRKIWSQAITTAGDTTDALLVPKEAAAFLKLSISWLAKSRKRGDGPPYIKFNRSVRYRRSALLEWLNKHQR